MNNAIFNAGDILETIRMIQDECLDIRTTTMGISLLDCIDSDIHKACDKVYDKITRLAEKLVASVETIEKEFNMENTPDLEKRVESQGIDEVINIGKNFGIDDINLIKPGIGETTRVLLRRIPWKVLIDERYKGNPQLEHIVRLAEEKHTPVEYYPLIHYKCCGIIKKLADA